MPSDSVIVRYDGPALAGHQMDVADLAPALLGLSDLCKLANSIFNGDRAAIKVLISADQEHKCFQFSLDIVQTLWQHAQALVEQHDIKTSKEILEWLGIIEASIGGIAGLFRLLKWLGNRKVTGTTLTVKDGHNVTQVQVAGNNNNVMFVHPETYAMLDNPTVIASAKKVVEPLTKDGYENVEFESHAQITEKITKTDAETMIARELIAEQEEAIEKPQQITAWVKVYAPVYDTKADQWRFQFGQGHERMDISETNIAETAIKRGGALIDDTYKVLLEIQQTKTPSGQIRVKYKIKKVIEFHPAKIPTQMALLNENNAKDS